MYIKLLTTTALLSAITSPVAFSDQIIPDDLIVSGNSCIGFDCVNNMVFGSETLRIQENNNRIHFIDSSAGDALGKSWQMIANGSNNGGANKFQIEARSPTKDSVLISDGTYPEYDCSAWVIGDTSCATVGLIPTGEPVLIQDTSNYPSSYTNTTTSPWFTVSSGLYLGTAGDDTVSIGADSELVSGAVSIGKADLKRKLIHVAKALTATDIATVADIEALTAKLDAIDRQLNEIDSAVDAIEGSPLFRSGGSLAPYSLLALAVAFLFRLTRSSRNGVQQ